VYLPVRLSILGQLHQVLGAYQGKALSPRVYHYYTKDYKKARISPLCRVSPAIYFKELSKEEISIRAKVSLVGNCAVETRSLEWGSLWDKEERKDLGNA
jgi:hypothetical protein